MLSNLKFVAFVIMLLGLSGTGFAASIITEIDVQGNRYVEKEAVLEEIRSKVGEPLNMRTLSRDVRRLFATGYFSDIYTEGVDEAGGVKLVFVVSENPVIASVRVEGREEFTKKKIKNILKVKPGVILSPLVERKTVANIQKKYFEKGYYHCEVDIEALPLEDGRVDVVVRINEGSVTLVKDIRILGNKKFSDTVLVGLLASTESGFGSFFSDSDIFSKDRFGADSQLLQRHYLEHGFLDVTIPSTRLMLTPSLDSFYLSLSVHEGQAFTVSAIELKGDTVPSKEKLMEGVELEVGELYALSKMSKSIDAITETVGDEGFAFATVTPSFKRNLEDNRVVVIFDIEKGREVYVNKINIIGNDKTKDHVIRRELRQDEGARYKASAIRRSRERVTRLSYLENVRLSNSKTDSLSQVDLDINVDEGKSGSFSAGISYSAQNQLGFNGNVTERNLFGEGYNVGVSADVGGTSNNYSLNLTDPYFIWRDVSGSASVFKRQTNLQSFVSYDYDSNGGSMGLGFALSEYLRYSFSYNITKTTLSGVPTTSSLALRSQEGTFETGELRQALSFDTRNRTFAPSEGGLQTLSLGYAGLTGDYQFYEINMSSRNYFPISDTFTLRGIVEAGSIQKIGDLAVPIYRRYSLGGVSSLRGYDIFGVSVVDPVSLDVFGGNYKSKASLDLLFPLPFLNDVGFRGTFFVDLGTVWSDSGAVSESFDLTKVRASYGFGMEWASPVGPLTLSWGYPFNEQDLDKERRFEFALGQGF